MIGNRETRTRYEVELIRQHKAANNHVRGYETFGGTRYFAAPSGGSHGLVSVDTMTLVPYQATNDPMRL